jgi:Transglutaminase-like superfamily
MFLLTEYTYAAVIEGGLVFLNLKSDNYTYLTPDDARRILPLISGANAVIDDYGKDEDTAETGPIIQELKRAGLVTAGQSGRPFEPIHYDAVVRELPRLVGSDRPHLGLRHVFAFCRAVLLSKILLKLVSLDRVVEFVRKRKVKAERKTNIYSRGELTEVYRRLRPLLLTRKDQCLLDSLSLVMFLTSYGVRASLRFGVRLGPFRAHAWVQDQGTIFDEMAALVHEYTVILEV